MVVMNPVRGMGLGVLSAARTPISAVPGNAAVVARAQAATGSFLVAQPVRGLGDGTPQIPDWAIWAAGGLAAGAVVGFVLWKRKRKG